MSDEKTLDEHIEDVRDSGNKENDQEETKNGSESKKNSDASTGSAELGGVLILGIIGAIVGASVAGPYTDPVTQAVTYAIVASVSGWLILTDSGQEFIKDVNERAQERQRQQQQQQIKTSQNQKRKVVCQHCGWQNNNNNNYCNDCGKEIDKSD